MEETTITETTEADEGGENLQPDANTDTPAGESTEETHPTPENNTTPDDDEPDEATEWLRNKGVDPNDPKAVAEAWRKAEQEFHKGREDTSKKLRDQVNEAVTDDQDTELANEVRQLKAAQKVNDFFSDLRDSGLTKDQINEIDAALAVVIQKRPHLGTDLDAAYAVVLKDQHDKSLVDAEKKGRAAAKAQIARASTAKTPAGNPSTSKPANDDEFVKGFKEL